jgi:hypothetical protein
MPNSVLKERCRNQVLHHHIKVPPTTSNSVQSVELALDLVVVRQFVDESRRLANELGLQEDDFGEFNAELAAISAHLDSPRPKHAAIRSSLGVIKGILTDAAISATSSGLLELLHHIHP